MVMFRKKQVWVFGGAYCESHLISTCKVYGTAKVMTIDPETVSTDDRCQIENCKGHIRFVIERQIQVE